MHFTYYEAHVDSLVPRGAPTDGGTALTVSGHNLWSFGVDELRVNGTVRAYTEEPRCFFVDAAETELVCSHVPRAVCGSSGTAVDPYAVDPYAPKRTEEEQCFYDASCDAAWSKLSPPRRCPSWAAAPPHRAPLVALGGWLATLRGERPGRPGSTATCLMCSSQSSPMMPISPPLPIQAAPQAPLTRRLLACRHLAGRRDRGQACAARSRRAAGAGARACVRAPLV